MKGPPACLLFALSLLLIACASPPPRTVLHSRPATSGTAAEFLQAQRDREQEDAANAAAATQKQLDELRNELDALKRQQVAGSPSAHATAQANYLEYLRKRKAEEDAAKRAALPAVRPDPQAKAIDAQVADILGGEHGKLPPAQKLRGNSSGVASIRVTNDTAHTLTVLYSGPTSKKCELRARQSETVTLSAGDYKVAARVDDPTIIPFAGKDTLAGGDYSNSFYITTSFP